LLRAPTQRQGEDAHKARGDGQPDNARGEQRKAVRPGGRWSGRQARVEAKIEIGRRTNRLKLADELAQSLSLRLKSAAHATRGQMCDDPCG
jgi:hypothetical protein